MANAGPSDRVRVLSFNVNGLAAILKRLGHPNVTALLADIGKAADIVCFQETKLRRSELAAASHQLATAEGWDSVFCCADSSRGYSGTATFFRTARACPFSAEVGFSGTLHNSSSGRGGVGGCTGEGEAHLELLSDSELSFSIEELRSLDSEGRVVITDHGAFLLYNIYAPAITAADPQQAQQRRDFKARFYAALQRRWAAQLAAGRAVVAVGDFNIAPAPIDHPDAAFEAEFYSGHHSRRWLRDLLRGGAISEEAALAGGESEGAGGGMPPFVDCFRAFHPTRRAAFTQWSTVTGARINNYGSRIDLTLAAGLQVSSTPPFSHNHHQQQQPQWPATGNSSDLEPKAAGTAWVSGADIQPDVGGSDHCPVWVEISTKGKFPCAAALPRCASSLSISAGKQTKLLSWLSGGGEGGATGAVSEAGAASSGGREKRGEAAAEVSFSTLERKNVLSSSVEKLAAVAGGSIGVAGGAGSPAKGVARRKGALSIKKVAGAPLASSSGARKAGSSEARGLPGKQASLKQFFQKPVRRQQQQQQQQQISAAATVAAAAEILQPPAAAPAAEGVKEPEDAGPATECEGLIEAELAAAAAQREIEQAESKQRWRQIQQRMLVPRCKHGELAARKKVNKAGENHGRYFYMCARAAGKGPEAQCGFFQWVKDAPRAASGKNSKSGGGGGDAPMAKRTKLQ